MTDSDFQIVSKQEEILNKSSVLPVSPSFSEKIYRSVLNNPFSAISSICVLFILLILTFIFYKFIINAEI